MTIELPHYFIAIEGRDLSGAARTAYEQQIVGMITIIQARKSGQLVLEYIRRSGTGRWVTIAPYGPYWQKRYGAANALSTTDWPPGAKVNFSVDTWMGPAAVGAGLFGGPGYLPDEILLHELVHAQRQISGIDRDISLAKTSLSAFENEEEFFSVLVANVYISETGRTSPTPGLSRLRSDHFAGALPDGEDNDLVQLLDLDYIRLIKKYCDQHPKLSHALANVDTPFNPFRTHYRLAT